MHEIVGELFDSVKAEAICITTNGFVNSQGANTMGRGNALQAKQRWPGIQLILGQLIRESGNQTHSLTYTESKLPPVIRLSHRICREWPHNMTPSFEVPYYVVAFPTKHHWSEDSDPKLIEKSARELVDLANRAGWDSIVLPRPGCGLGKLSWEGEVRPLLMPILDDRFYVISPK